jgi:hypothetical protein
MFLPFAQVGYLCSFVSTIFNYTLVQVFSCPHVCARMQTSATCDKTDGKDQIET